MRRVARFAGLALLLCSLAFSLISVRAGGPGPGEVTNLELSGGALTTLLWDEVAGATGYDAVASNSPAFDQDQELLALNLASPDLQDLFVPAAGQTRYYLVRARNGSGFGTWGFSSEGAERAPALPPAPPVFPGLAFLAGTDVDEVMLVWLPAADDTTVDSDIVYEVHLSQTPDFEPTPTTKFGEFVGVTDGSVSGLQAGTTYHALVVAVDEDSLGSEERDYQTIATPELPIVLSATTPLEDAQVLGLGEPVISGTTLTFTPLGAATPPSVGAVLVGPAGQDGYLRRVDSVTSAGNQIIVETSDASLSDAVEQMGLSMTVVLFDVDQATATMHGLEGQATLDVSVPGGDEAPRTVRIEWPHGLLRARQTTFDRAATEASQPEGNDPVTITHEFDFEPGFTVDWNWTLLGGLENAEVIATGDMTAGLTISYEFTGQPDFMNTIPIWDREFFVQFLVGSVPIFGRISISLKAEILATADAVFNASIGGSATGNVSVGTRYDSASGWSPFYEDQFSVEVSPPSATAEVSVTGDVRLVPEVEITFFPAIPAASVGGTLSAEPFIHGDLHALADATPPCFVEFTEFDADLGVECNASLSAHIIFHDFPDITVEDFCPNATKKLLSLPEIKLEKHVVSSGIGVPSNEIDLEAIATPGANNRFADPVGTHPEWFVSPAAMLNPAFGSMTTTLQCLMSDTYTVTFQGHGELTFFANQCETVTLPCPVEGPLYNFDVVAVSGAPLPDLSAVDQFGIGTSINNSGDVAFTARDVNGVDALLVEEDGNIESYLGPVVTFALSDYVQIDDADRVVWHERSEDGLFTNIKRVGRSGQDFLIIALNHSPPFQTSPFDLPLEWVTMNNAGKAVFSADIGAETFIVSGDTSSGYFGSPPFTGFPEFFPQVADNDTIVARVGGTSSDPLFLYTDLTFGTAFLMAGTPEFLAVGQSPGISDDGQLLAFMGHSADEGVGIFAALGVGSMGEPPQFPFKIAGNSGFSTFSLVPRVGVDRSNPASPDEYTVAYLATSDVGSLPLGLYTTRVNVSNPGVPLISTPKLVTEVGQMIDGLEGAVEDLAVYDPVNASGQLVFWVRTSDVRAVVRAKP